MQKQHLHLLLLVFGCCLWQGCGEAKFSALNPYLHGEQALSFPLPDSLLSSVIIAGWEFLPVASLGSNSGPCRVRTPDGRLIRIDWVREGSASPLLYSKRVRSVHGLNVINPALGLTCSLAVANDGRSLSVSLIGESTTAYEARIVIEVGGLKARGLAALEETWTETEGGKNILLPWGDRWQILSDGEIIPLPRNDNEISGKISFREIGERKYLLNWAVLSSSCGKRGLDIDTESMANDQALAMLIAGVPPVHAGISSDAVELEFAADLTLAQWLVHAEYSPSYLSELSVSENQAFLLTYGLSAYQTLYAWGTLPTAEVLGKEPLLDATMSRLDTSSLEIERGASLETRFREAVVWTFAEEYLATDRPEIRKVYRNQAVVALDDAQEELKERFRLWRKANSVQRPDSVALYELFVGRDSAVVQRPHEVFVAPDSLAILKIVGSADLNWFTEVSPLWNEINGLSWPLELERLRWKFEKNIKLRLSDHWATAQAALLDGDHPGEFPEKQFGAPLLASAAGEIETIVRSYLGIRPHWRESTITFDARLPEGWGRTRARIPFADGELYVDYDFSNDRAWLAANGLSQSYTCTFYLPTPSGAISGQFKLKPGDSPRLLTLFIDPNNKYLLRIDDDSLPE